MILQCVCVPGVWRGLLHVLMVILFEILQKPSGIGDSTIRVIREVFQGANVSDPAALAAVMGAYFFYTSKAILLSPVH